MKACPDKCSGGGSTRQSQLSEDLLSKLSESAQKRVSESKGSAYRCNYCGCVYIRELSSDTKLGDLDGGVTGQGWKSVDYP